MKLTKGTGLQWIYEGYPDEPALRGLDRTALVPGIGPYRPRVIIVGEAPGRTEVQTGHPFTGRAGILLDGMLARAGLDRPHCWVTNVVKYRPVGPDGRDRPPTGTEVAVSMPYLWRELEHVSGGQCKVIAALGRTAASALYGREVRITASHGSWRIITDPAGVRYALFITYHPAAALRQAATAALLEADIAALAAEVADLGGRAAEQLG